MSTPAAVVPGRSLAAVGERLREAFEAAARTNGRITRTLGLAGQTLELEFAGEAMLDKVVPALSHLLVPARAGAAADLRIGIWDARLPELPPAMTASGLHDGRRWVALRPWESSLSWLDATTGAAFHCVADPERIAPYEIAHPLTELLGWWFGRSGLYIVHSAAVGTAAGGVLLAGPSGAGKSTSALACLKAGMAFAGDDAVLVGDDPPVARSLYCSARADPGLLSRHPDALPRLPLASGEDKAAAFFDRERVTAELPLRGIVLPRVVPGGRSRLHSQRAGVALLRLAPEPVLRQRRTAARSLGVLAGLVRRLPVRALEVGNDLERIPDLLRELIEALAECE